MRVSKAFKIEAKYTVKSARDVSLEKRVNRDL